MSLVSQVSASVISVIGIMLMISAVQQQCQLLEQETTEFQAGSFGNGPGLDL
jgi:hypothetical protein